MSNQVLSLFLKMQNIVATFDMLKFYYKWDVASRTESQKLNNFSNFKSVEANFVELVFR